MILQSMNMVTERMEQFVEKGPIRVLIVDDEAMIRKGVVALLS